MSNPKPTIMQEIESLVKDTEVVLFMKGTAIQPACGFSATLVRILDKLGVKFLDINVLKSDELRQGIKDYTDWPTIPQLYIKGEFMGGCDIIKQLYQEGKLNEIFKNHGLLP